MEKMYPSWDRLSIEIEGAIEKSSFYDFWEKLKKLKNPTYLIDCTEFEDIKHIKKYDPSFLKKKLEINIIKQDKTIRCNKLSYKVEFVMQKYNMFDKKTKKETKKVCKIFNNFSINTVRNNINTAGIHVNFDARSFFPYLSEIYLKNMDKFDFNNYYRKKIDKKMVEIVEYQPLNDDTLSCIIMKNKMYSINLEPIKKEGRFEFRIFDSNHEGRKKLIEFLDNTKKIVKEGRKKYELLSFDMFDLKNYRKKEYQSKIKFGCTSNTLRTNNRYENFDSFIKKHKKGEEFIIKQLFSASFDIYDKYL